MMFNKPKDLSDKQWILKYIRMYNDPYDRYESLGPEDHTKFNKLMKPYSKYKKYIFTVPESEKKAILDHKYHLKSNKEKMKSKLNENEIRKCKEMVKRYSVKMRQSELKKYKSTRRALQKCKVVLNKTKKGGNRNKRNKRIKKGRRQTRGNKHAIKLGKINVGRELNRYTLQNWGVKGSVPVNKAYRDVKELIDEKKAQQYFKNQFNDFSGSRSRSRSSRSRSSRSRSRSRSSRTRSSRSR